LDGVDDDWQEVGSRTEAVYTRLHPGHYSFQVVIDIRPDLGSVGMAKGVCDCFTCDAEEFVLYMWLDLDLRLQNPDLEL